MLFEYEDTEWKVDLIKTLARVIYSTNDPLIIDIWEATIFPQNPPEYLIKRAANDPAQFREICTTWCNIINDLF